MLNITPVQVGPRRVHELCGVEREESNVVSSKYPAREPVNVRWNIEGFKFDGFENGMGCWSYDVWKDNTDHMSRAVRLIVRKAPILIVQGRQLRDNVITGSWCRTEWNLSGMFLPSNLINHELFLFPATKGRRIMHTQLSQNIYCENHAKYQSFNRLLHYAKITTRRKVGNTPISDQPFTIKKIIINVQSPSELWRNHKSLDGVQLRQKLQ